eukprot:gene14857-19971_t
MSYFSRHISVVLLITSIVQCLIFPTFHSKTGLSLLKSTINDEQNKPPIYSKPREYIPRNKPTYNSNPDGPRVYRPKSMTNANNTQSQSSYREKPKSYVQNSNRGESNMQIVAPILLTDPQLLIRFKFPREKSKFKLELEQLQQTFRDQSEMMKPRESTGGGGRDAFYDNFTPPPPPPSADTDNRKGSFRPKPTSKEVAERKGGSEFGKSRGQRKSVDDQDYEDVDKYGDVGESEFAVEADDYYGDDSNLGLSSVSSTVLQNMDAEGFTLEEMQVALYGEYGVKVSMGAIKKRLNDDKSEKKRRKKTGKTKRDKMKIRNAKRNPIEEKKLVLPESGSIQIRELSSLMDVGAGEVIKHLMMNMGMMVTLTQSIPVDTAKTVALAFGKILASDEDDEEDEDEDVEEDEDEDEVASASLAGVEKRSRPPVVTIMGHVDHGKTTLLDKIRNTKVALGEAGGITQGISAFSVQANENQMVTFIDTPGHAAFSNMRKRGANVTDIVILVVAADDGVMEQTKECITAAKAAGCPIVVAINKIDKEGVDVDGIKSSLVNYGVVTEDFGGDVQCVGISAKTGIGIDELIEKVLLQAEVMSLSEYYDTDARGTILETRVDKGLGVVVTGLLQRGTLKVGDLLLAGPAWGRVRRLISDQGKDIKYAEPSTPVQIVGLNAVPNAGDVFLIASNEIDAREVADARRRLSKQAAGSASSAAIKAQALGFAGGTIDGREVIKVPLLIKADVSGSLEALRNSVEAIQAVDDLTVCKIDLVYAGVGDVTSSDIAIAAVAKAKIVAFNAGASYTAIEEARSLNVDIGYYSIVYELLDELEKTVKVTLAPPPPGELIGRAEVKKIFKLGKAGKIAGCVVTEGYLKMDSNIRIMRGKRNPIHSGKISTLKVVKEDVKEVPIGSDCGIAFEDFIDFEEGDVIECYS